MSFETIIIGLLCGAFVITHFTNSGKHFKK